MLTSDRKRAAHSFYSSLVRKNISIAQIGIIFTILSFHLLLAAIMGSRINFEIKRN